MLVLDVQLLERFKRAGRVPDCLRRDVRISARK